MHPMRTLSISISDVEFYQYGLNNDNLTFSDIIEKVSRELMRQNLNKTVELAEKYGLSSMSMEEISEEVKAVRRDAKNRHWYECAGFGFDSAAVK
jgi:predicted CopG family antitoxin